MRFDRGGGRLPLVQPQLGVGELLRPQLDHLDGSGPRLRLGESRSEHLDPLRAIGERGVPALDLGEQPLDLMLGACERRSGSLEAALELFQPLLRVAHLVCACLDLHEQLGELGVALFFELACERGDAPKERELKSVSQSVHAA
jgi:hypothetical protein